MNASNPPTSPHANRHGTSPPGDPQRAGQWKTLVPLMAVSMVWSAFSFWLFSRGHAPSGPSPFPPSTHYAWQAALLPIAIVFAFVGALKMARLGIRGAGQGRDVELAVTAPLAWALSLALLVTFVLPDLFVFATAGFESLALALRYTMPLLVVTSVILVAGVLLRLPEISKLRAVIFALLTTATFFFLLSLIVR